MIKSRAREIRDNGPATATAGMIGNRDNSMRYGRALPPDAGNSRDDTRSGIKSKIQIKDLSQRHLHATTIMVI